MTVLSGKVKLLDNLSVFKENKGFPHFLLMARKSNQLSRLSEVELADLWVNSFEPNQSAPTQEGLSENAAAEDVVAFYKKNHSYLKLILDVSLNKNLQVYSEDLLTEIWLQH